MPPLTCAQSRQVDRIAMDELGIPGVVLMENAGRSAAEYLRTEIGPAPSSVGFVCGGGNNGGDGYVAARHLANHGVDVTLYALRPPRPDSDAAVHATIADRMGLRARRLDPGTTGDALAAAWSVHDLLVDALLGTGFRQPPRPDAAAVIGEINQCRGPQIVAFDLPSGFDGDTADTGSGAVRADMTITFASEKIGFTQPGAAAWLGRVVVADIGVPPWVIERAGGSVK